MVRKVYNKSTRTVNVGGIKVASKDTINLTEDMINEIVLKSIKHLEQMGLITVFEKDEAEIEAEKPAKKTNKKNKK